MNTDYQDSKYKELLKIIDIFERIKTYLVAVFREKCSRMQ
jgi:hypothetical protein